MFDYLATKRHYGPVEVGTIVRNNGYGSRLMRVVEIIPGGYRQEVQRWDPVNLKNKIPSIYRTHDKVILESYGLLDYGNIKYPTIPKRIPAYISLADKNLPTFIYSIGPGQMYKESNASYTPVTIVSKMITTEIAYNEGVKYHNWIVNGSGWRRHLVKGAVPEQLKNARKYLHFHRYVHHELLQAAFIQGFDRGPASNLH